MSEDVVEGLVDLSIRGIFVSAKCLNNRVELDLKSADEIRALQDIGTRGTFRSTSASLFCLLTGSITAFFAGFSDISRLTWEVMAD
jgi:hypothetical protein